MWRVKNCTPKLFQFVLEFHANNLQEVGAAWFWCFLSGENSHDQFGKIIILPVPLMIFSQQMKWGFLGSQLESQLTARTLTLPSDFKTQIPGASTLV